MAAQLKLLHTGLIRIGKEIVFIANKGTRQYCLFELNNWLFDYCYANALPIVQLPPLDDWTPSDERENMWSFDPIELPTIAVILKSELVEFN